MKRKTTTILFAAAALAPLGAVATAGAPVATTVTAEPLEAKQVRGNITSMSGADSFVVKDDAEKEHAVNTNDKTRYQLDGEEATRDQVVAKGATVEVDLAEDGSAMVVNRITR